MSKTRMGKRVASLLLSLVMMLSLLPTTVYATGDTGETKNAIVEETNTSDDNTAGGTTGNPELTGEDEGGGGTIGSEGETATVATIGEAKYETLDAAITAVADGQTIVVNAGEYTLNGSLAYADKAFTIAAAEGAKVSFDMSAAVALHGAKITFNNVTFDYKTNGNYIGLQHTDTLVYNNCIINGMVFLYAVNETFNGCTFNQTSAGAYNVWTYGAQNVAFNGCQFFCAGKAVLVYNEGAVAKTDLTVTDTKFIASAPVEDKAAIEIDTSLMEGGATITVDDKTTAAGFDNGSNSGNPLWNDKKQTADTNKNTTVTVAGEKVFEPVATASAVAQIGETTYETLAEAIAAATAGQTVTLLTDLDLSTKGLTIAKEKAVTLDLNGKTLKVANTNSGNIKVFGKLTLQDSTDTDKNGTGTGKVWTETPYIYGSQDKVLITAIDGGTFTMESGLIDAASSIADNANNGQFAVSVQNETADATVIINGGCIKAGWYAIAGNGQDIKYNGNITVNGGILESTADYAIYHPHSGTTTINGGVVFGAAGGVSLNRGKLIVNNGIITSKGTGTTGDWGDGTGNQNAAAINVNAQYGSTSVEIKGGKITAEKDAILLTNGKDGTISVSGGTFSSAVKEEYCAEGYTPTANADGTYGVVEAATAVGDGTEANPYTLEQLGAMTRQEYIDAQNRLNGTMYVTVGDYAYDTNGVLGNGVRDDTTGQTPDHSKLNAYGENGYLGEKNDGANGKSVVFVGGSITSGVTGYTSIDKIGTSLLLALPAYTNVTFKGITFNNVMSFNYQLYTSPWSQLGELKFDGCTFNGIIVGAIAAQTLTFNGCEFKNYTNTTDANSSNPTWIRPAYGNWTQGDNEGQGSDFRSLTAINFTGNTVTSTRPVKFEYISQWNITSTVTATGNFFDISRQAGDTAIKNVGLYLGAHTDANAFNLVAENNTKSENTAALYTIPEGKTSLPLGSTVKNLAGEPVELTDALKWKAGDATADKLTLKSVPLVTSAVASIGTAKYETLAEAFAAAKDGDTITLLTDCSGDGIRVEPNTFTTKGLTVDFAGHTYTVGGKLVGSGGTKSNGFQLNKDNKITFRNGAIYGDASVAGDDTTNWTGAPAILIQNYCDLTLSGMKVSGGYNTVYTMSNNCGTVVIENTTINAGGGGSGRAPFALDACGYSDYTGVSVTVKGTSTINGDIEVSRSASNENAVTLTLENGTVNGTLKIDSSIKSGDATTVTKSANVTLAAPDGYLWNAAGELVVAVAQVGENKYETLAAAIAAANNGETVTLLKDVTENVEIAKEKNLTLDLNGKTLSGGTGTAKAALSNLGTITIQDTSAAKTGTIKRDDNGTVGETSYYVIRNQGTMTIESGTVINNSGYRKTNPTGSMVGSSLICNGDCDEGGTLTIKGGTFTQNNFIAIKNGALGVLHVTGGKITSNHSAIQNWFKADITGGEIKGQLWTDAWEEGKSVGETKIGGGAEFTGEIVMDITGSVVPTLAINGGNLDVTNWRITSTAAKAGAKPAVSGGTFSSAVPAEYCAEGFIPVKNADGTYGVKAGAYVAQIGDVKYETLKDAVNAAKDGDIVMLLTDATEDVTINKNITLDLGGKTLTNTGAGKATVTIDKGATATVQNGSIIGGTSYYNIQNNGTATFTGVTATAGNTGSSMIDNWGTLTIESGTYEGGLNVVKSEEGSTLTINGGKFTLNYAPSSDYTAVILVYGNTTITGGEFIQSLTTTGKWAHPQVVMTGVVEGYEAFTTVTGGTFTNKKSGEGIFRGIGKATSDNFEVSGGTFNKSVPDSYFKTGYFAKKTADGYTADGPYAVRIGTTAGYATLEEAFAAAKNGNTITLLRDCESGRINLEDKSVTVDLNGKVLTSTAAYGVMFCAKNGHKITVKGDTRGSKLVGTLMVTAETDGHIAINGGTYESAQYCPIYINGAVSSDNSTLTVKNATITALPGDSNQDNGVAVYLAGYSASTFTKTTITAPVTGLEIRAGKLTLTNCTVTGGSGEVVTNANGNGTTVTNAAVAISQHTTKKDIDVTITGGTYTATAAVYQTNVQGTGSENVKASIKSGTFKGSVSAETNNTVAVSGGTFSSAVKEEYCATGYIPKDNGDGTYGVKEGVYVAKVDNVKYETLQAAIDAAKGGSTVRLLANVTLTETAVFPAGKTVHLNLVGHNITATGTALRINGTTDIQDTNKTGTIESTGNVAVAVGDNASLTVYSGTLKGREGAVITGTSTGAKIEIRKNATLIATDNAVIAGNGSQRDGNPNTILVKGGTFIGGIVTDGYIACGIYAPWNDNVTVSGGTFNITNGAGIVARAGTVKVTGGTFNCTGTAEGYVGDSKNKVPCAALVFDEAANYPALTPDSKILVSGGSFSTDPAANGAKLADGYVAIPNADGVYKVAKANPVAAIGDVKYDTLQAAITAAQDTKDGATITLLTDINTSSYYEVKGENPVTIDLAGHNITGSGISGLFYVTVKGDLTIKGEGTVTAVEDNKAAMAVWVRSSFAKVTLEGGTYTQQITNTADPHFDLIYVERGNVYVKGGTYKGFTPDWTLNCKDDYYQSKEANIEVTGGTFVGFDPANNKAEGENTNFVPAGYVSTKGADGNYTVEEYKPVEVWTGYSGAKVASYATVAEAAEKLDGNKWIVIGKDYTLTEDFTIGGENLDNLYLDVAEGATLTVAEGVTLTVAANAKRLGVRDGATLVNKGTIVVCGSSTSNGFAMLYGTFTGNELTVPEGCFLDNNGKNFFATANENAVYEITFGDGTVKKTADSTNIKGGNVKQIKLLKDVTNGGWTLDSSSVGAEVVLDLNGHTISYNGANRYYATLNVYTKVTIKNGTVKYEGSKRGAIDLVGQGDLTIERDVTIDGGDGFAIFTSGTSKLTVNGKVTANGNYAIAGNGSKDAGGYIDSCDIIVNGGAVISASKGIAIYHPEKGTVTINGGTITGHTGIEMCAGQLVVNGGSITSNGDNMDATGSQNAILDGAAISIINRNYPGGVPTAVIKGGTFAANGKDAQTVKAYDYTGDKVAEWTAAGDNVNISGGTFSSIPTNMGVLCADGYKTVYDAYADMYNVVKQDAKITVGKRLSIGNDLTITYLVSLTDCTNPWVKFQFYNDDIKGYTTVEVKNYGTDTVTGPDGKPMDVFTFDFTGINPQRMTDTLKATVYAKDANGNVVEYQVDDYSVAQYCSNKLAKLGQNDPLRKLIGNLVAYGAAAQVYQNYRTDNLVSTVVSGAVSTDYTDRLSSVTQYTEKVLGTAGVNIKGKTLVLSNTFAVRVYFTVNEGVDIANVSFNVTANGKTDTVNSFEKDEKLGYYYFDYANLNATQLDSEVKFESFVNETGVGDMVTYSVNTYLAKKMPNYDKSSNAYKLMAELFNYGCACTEYASK